MSIHSVSSSGGTFTIQNNDGSTQKLSFGDLIMSMGMMQLKLQDSYFEEQYKKTSEMAQEMQDMNSLMALLTKYKGYFDKDGKPTSHKLKGHEDLVEFTTEDLETWKKYRTEFVDTGKVSDPLSDPKNENSGMNTNGNFNYQELTTVITSAEAYQKNLSSMNEQQMMVTNQAASRRSNVLQQMQTLLTSEKEGRAAAVR